MTSPHGLAALDDPIVRFPTSDFWFEGFSDDSSGNFDDQAKGDRLGLLVEMDASGRSGKITVFGEEPDGSAALLAGRIVFDLDSRMPSDNAAGRYRMRHDDLPEVNSLLSHACLVFDARWLENLRGSGVDANGMIKQQADIAWCALPLLVAFKALLNSRTALIPKPSELSRLNLARARRSKPALLEHVEISLNLTPSSDPDRVAAACADRVAPRFHFVRGHPVRRAGKTFWRTSHFRGAHGAMPITTVRVTASAQATGRMGTTRAAHRTDAFIR